MKTIENADAVIVTASRERWRAGRKFPTGKPVTVPFSDLTEAQAKQLEDDPLLSLRYVELGENDPTAAILDAIEELDREKDFNQDGTPKVNAVSKILGREVTKAEIAEALDTSKIGDA